MSLPVMTIIFASAAQEAVKRSERGVVGMILKDTAPETNPVIVYKEKDIPGELSADTKEQIRFALKGNVYNPSKIVAYILKADATDYTEALNYFAVKKVNWLCCPTVASDAQTDAIKTWVTEQRKNRNKVKAVLPEITADNEGIINYATKNVVVGEKTYTAEDFCSRIAGLLAGTPAKQGATYSVLEEVAECEVLDGDALETADEKGKFILFYDGEKVKAGRAVNSLTTTSETKTDPWRKINVVETMDMMNDDLILLVEDNYIGKYRNTYNNKCLLLNAIKAYFTEIARAGLIEEDFIVDLDADMIRDYIIETNKVPRDIAEEMGDTELKKQYTDEKIFFRAVVTIVDIMEDIVLNIAA